MRVAADRAQPPSLLVPQLAEDRRPRLFGQRAVLRLGLRRRRRPGQAGRPDRASPTPWRWARRPWGLCRWNRSSSTRTSRGTSRRRRDRCTCAARPRPCGRWARGRGRTGGRRSRRSAARPGPPSRACCPRRRTPPARGRPSGRIRRRDCAAAYSRRQLLQGLVVAAPLLAVPTGRDVRIHVPILASQH